MSGLSTIFKMAVKAAAAPNKKLLDMKYTRETPKTKKGFSSVDLASEGKITDQEAIGGLFNPISFNKGGMKVGPDASNLNTSRIEISTFNPTSTPGPLGFGMKAADDIGLPSTAVGNKTKDAIKVQTNLIEGSKWKWEGKVPKGFENNTHLVSMQGGSKLKKASGGPTDHSYATKVIYEKGGNLSTYDTRAEYVKELHKSIPESLAALKIKIPKEVEKLIKELKAEGKSTEEIKKKVDALKKKLTRDYKGDNPKGKPTTVGVPEFGKKIGKIKKGGIIQPVYDQIIMREAGGQVMPMQYGGGISNAYSTLSDRRRNQNMYGMGDAPMQQMPSQMSSVFQDPMEASAFSPVNMEQGGDIVVPTIYRQEGGSIPITSVNGLGIPRIVYREEGGGVDDSDSNYGGFGNFGDDFGDLGPGGSSDSFDDSGQDALNEYLGESNITDLGSVRTPQGFEGGDVPNSFNTYVVSPTTGDIRNQAFVDRNQIVRDYINTPYFSGQALANLNQAQQPTAEELDQEDKDLTYDFVNIKDEVDKASGEIGLKNYLGVNPNSRKEGDKAPAFNSVSLNPDGDSNTRALGDSINQAQGFEGRSLVDDGKEGLSTFLGESSLADAFGTPSNPTGPGEGFTESRNKDRLSNELANQSLRGDQRIVYMSVRNKNPNLTPDQVVELIDTIQKNSTIGKKEGGLIGIPKERMINDQPHQLSYINPQEAGLLKALGGSGRRVDGIPAYFDTGMENDFSEGTGESFSGGDFSERDSQDFYDYYTDPQNVNVEGTITGDNFQSGEDSSPTLADLYRSQGYSPNEIAEIAGYRGGLSDVERDEFNFGKRDAQSLQDAIDRGQFKGAGGTFGRTLESLGLATHGKGIYGPLEAFVPGNALYYDQKGYEAGPRSDEVKDVNQRGQYNADNIIGGVDADPAVNLFDMYMSDPFRNKSETIAETASRFEAENPGMVAPTEAFGYSRNSSTLTSDLMDSLNDSRRKGALQGGLMMLGAGINPVGLIGNLSTRYEDGKTKNMYSDVTDVVQDTLGLNTGKGKSIGDAVEIINDPAGYLSRNIDTVGKSVPDLGPIEDVKAEQARQADIAYNAPSRRMVAPAQDTINYLNSGDVSLGSLAPDPREAPEQNMFEKGISSVVDFFGGPQAAYRNNIDVRQGEGQDAPVSRRPRINEPVESATASSSESNDGRLMNKFFAGLAATNVGKQSSGEGSIFRLIKSQNPQLTDDQIRAMIPNENNFA